jgi:hypothetical protein
MRLTCPPQLWSACRWPPGLGVDEDNAAEPFCNKTESVLHYVFFYFYFLFLTQINIKALVKWNHIVNYPSM